MKTLISFFFLISILSSFAFQSPDDFERNLSRVSSDFKEAIMDEDKCNDLKERAEDIVDDIEEILEETEGFSSIEISYLKELKKIAEGVEDYFAVVAGMGNSFPKFKDFMEANRRVGANIYRLSQYDFCVDVQVIELGEYRAYLVTNNSTANLRLSIEWITANGMRSGTSEVGIISNSIRHILDNRDGSLDNLIIQNITCGEF